jgi:hypothetical protein
LATRISTASRNAAANAIAALPDLGPGAGTVKVYTGSQPATGDAAETGTLLATFTLADPAFGSASSGVVSANSTPRNTTGVADGTAGWFRMEDSTGANILDGSVTATGGGGQMELNTTTISTGVSVSLTALTVTMPGS